MWGAGGALTMELARMQAAVYGRVPKGVKPGRASGGRPLSGRS